MLAFLLAALPVLANPAAGSVTHGAATITQVPGNTAVTGISNRAVIDWDSFSIANGEVTNFTFAAPGGAVLNKVTGLSASNINGALNSANGSVYLINPNGIAVGPTGVINVAGSFVASTLDVSPTQFMSGGDLDFQGNSSNSVVNRGSITAVEGDVFLIGAHVANHGTIDAAEGTVGLGAGNDVKLVDSAHPHLVVQPTAASLGGTGAENTGTIDAVRAQLAAAGGNVYALAINNEGTIRSNCAVSKDGRIFLTSEDGKIGSSGELIAVCDTFQGFSEPAIEIDAGTEGEIALSGIVTAKGTAANAQGGTVEVAGGRVDMTDLLIDVSNPTAGVIRVAALSQDPAGGDITAGPDFFFGNVALRARGEDYLSSHISMQAESDILLNDWVTLNTTDGNIDLTAGGNIVLATHSQFDVVNIFAEQGDVSLEGENVVLQNPYGFSKIEVGSRHGNTSVLAEDTVVVQAAGGGISRIGRAGQFQEAVADGNISVRAGNDVVLAATGASQSVSKAQIGNATALFGTGASGQNVVMAGGDVVLSSFGESLALIGHEGIGNAGLISGDTLVVADDDVHLSSSAGSRSHIGHFSDYGILEGRIAVLASDDITLSSQGDGSFSQIGHRLYCDQFGPVKNRIARPVSGVSGDIAVIAGEDVCLRGEEGSLALIGHENCVNPEATIESNILVAYSQRRLNDLKECNLRYDFDECIECLLGEAQSILPEGEGVFCMSPYSRIGGKVGLPVDGYVMIYGWREKIGEQETATLIEDGAVINSLVMNSGIPQGSTQGIYFNQSEPYVDWKHEQYGFSLLDLVCRPETVVDVYSDPFTIYYPFLCESKTPEEPDFHWEDPWWPHWPEYPYDARYCGCPETDGLAGTNSYLMYNPICGDGIPCRPCPCGPALPRPCVPIEALETEPVEQPTPAEPVKRSAPESEEGIFALLSSQ